MNVSTRFALSATTGLLLVLALDAGTARAAFMVNEIKIQYTLADADGNPIPAGGATIVHLVNGRSMPTDPTSPLVGKSYSNAQLDFSAYTGTPPNIDAVLTSLASPGILPKFALGSFFAGEINIGSVLFQMSQTAVVINPSVGSISGFEVDSAVTLDPADDSVTGQGAAGDPDFSLFYGVGGTAHFAFDPAISLEGSGDGRVFGNGNVTITITPNTVPEPASLASLFVAIGMIGTGAVARRVRSYFRPSALSS